MTTVYRVTGHVPVAILIPARNEYEANEIAEEKLAHASITGQLTHYHDGDIEVTGVELEEE